jgi:PAS domain S-box-containing protein
VTEKEMLDISLNNDIAEFTERYSSFSNIVNRMQSQYLSLKDIYVKQSDELQAVNESLQSLVVENREVTVFLNSILHSLSSGVIAVDNKGCVTHINPAAMRILGIEENFNERPGYHYDDLIVAVENGEYSATAAVASGTCISGAEKTVETYHGTMLTLSVSTSLLKNDRGEVTGAVEMFSDISKLKRLEEQLSRMKVLASLGEMAATIAHEIRNPLVGVSGFAALLERDLNFDTRHREMAKKIVSGVESINRIIQNLLDFARNEKVHKSTVNLQKYLNTVIDSFHQEHDLAESRKGIVRDFVSEPVINVELDSQLFKQALYNLLKNGLEAGGKKAEIVVRCTTLTPEEAQQKCGDGIELSGLETLVAIEIADNGPGITEDKLSKIFTPFYSTKENGTGLGLAIAWKIIKSHGGDLKAKSISGTGTTFSIVLPVQTN